MKMRFLHLISVLVMLLGMGCQQSPDPYTMATPETPRSTSDLVLMQQTEDMVSFFDQDGLDRLRDYLQSSTAAFNGASNLGIFLDQLNLHYDWKHTEETSNASLLGSINDPLGKLLDIMVINRTPHEAAEGLLLIIEDAVYFETLIRYFTQDKLFSDKEAEMFSAAIDESKISDVHKSIERLYDAFVEYFGFFYHTQSQRPEVIDGLTKIIPTSGWTENDEEILKKVYKPEIVAVITRFIKHYYDIQPDESGDENEDSKPEEDEPSDDPNVTTEAE